MEQHLQTHLAICEQIYELTLEENQVYKTTSRAPDDHILDRKRTLLAQLEAALEAVRKANTEYSRQIAGTHRALIEKTQQVIMKTLLLDRENEQLLLKTALASAHPAPPQKPTQGHLQRIYTKFYRS